MNVSELSRLYKLFEKQAASFDDVSLSFFYVGKDWISDFRFAGELEHVVPIWQYYGRIDTKEEYQEQMTHVHNADSSKPVNRIPGAQIYCFASLDGKDTKRFLRMAQRAGNQFSDKEVRSFHTQREQEIIRSLPGLRERGYVGDLKIWSGLFGQPMTVTNSNPVAVWLNFLHYNGDKNNPLQGRNHEVDLDPAVESLYAIEHLLEEHTMSKRSHRRSKLTDDNFRVALTFAGENRLYVGDVASSLSKKIDRVFYDFNYQAELARPNLDVFLQRVYLNADLVVVFLCERYAEKEWCGLEWRAIREIIKRKDDGKLMFMRFDDTEVPGVLSIDGYIDLKKTSPCAAANLIATRLGYIDES